MGKQQMRHLRTGRPRRPLATEDEPLLEEYQPVKRYRPTRRLPAASRPPHSESRPSLAQRAIRYLGGFMVLMVLFTLLSRAADELTIPRVTLGGRSEGTIDRTITGFGKVEELSAQAVTTQPGIRVAGIAVKTGARVEAGAPLFTLDTADLEDKLTEAREALARQDMDLEDRASQESLAAQDRAKALERANQDYAAAQTAADREVERASKALEQAKAKLNAAPPLSGDLSALETACIQAAANLKAAEEELARLEEETGETSTPSEAQGSQISPEDSGPSGDPDEPVEDGLFSSGEPAEDGGQEALDAARQKVAAAQTAKIEADEALAAYNEANVQQQLLRDNVDLAQESYDRAVESRNNTLRSASRQVEDAQRPQAQDSSGKKAEMDRERQAQQVSRLESLLQGGGIVRAPWAGTVTGINITVGSATMEGTAVLLAGDGNGCVFTAQLSSEQEKYLSPGDEAIIKTGGGRFPIEDLTIETVAPSTVDPSLIDVTVRLPEGTLAIGTAGELEVRWKSQPYPCRVPLSALHEDGSAYYLLVTQEKAGLLGTEITAARLDVTVLDKNESYAAIEPGALGRGQSFLASSNKPVSAGDRIRPEAQ